MRFKGKEQVTKTAVHAGRWGLRVALRGEQIRGPGCVPHPRLSASLAPSALAACFPSPTHLFTAYRPLAPPCTAGRLPAC